MTWLIFSSRFLPAKRFQHFLVVHISRIQDTECDSYTFRNEEIYCEIVRHNRKYGKEINRIGFHANMSSCSQPYSVALCTLFFSLSRSASHSHRHTHSHFFRVHFATDGGYAMERSLKDGGRSYCIVYLRFIICQLKSREYICSGSGSVCVCAWKGFCRSS